MKKIFLLVALSLASKAILAQLSTTLVVSGTPPGALIDWGNRKDVFTYIINNQGSVVRQGIVKVDLRLTDGTPVASSNLATANVFTLSSTTTILYASDVLALEDLVFVGRFKRTLDKTGKLPAGTYNLCLQVVSSPDFVPLSAQSCRTFTIASEQLPIPIMPGNETLLNIDQAKVTITFRWTPVAPNPTLGAIYRVMVFEILERQTPMQALRSNQPLLQKEVIGTTQYIWQHQLAFMPVTDSLAVNDSSIINGVNAYGFIWTIQTFDRQGRPLGDGNINGDGISEPAVFLIDRRPANIRNMKPPPTRIIYLNPMTNKRN